MENNENSEKMQHNNENEITGPNVNAELDQKVGENEINKSEISEKDKNKEIKLNDNTEKVPQTTMSFDSVKVNTKAKGKKDSGFKIFIALVLTAMLILICTTAGYFSGKNFSDGGNKTVLTELASKPSNAPSSSFTDVYNIINPSVVSISIYNVNTASTNLATGIIYSSDGYIVTNDHIYADIPSPKFLVRLSDGTEYKAKFIAGDVRTDLAVLKIDASGLTPVVLGDSNELSVGESIITVGYSADSSNGAILTQGAVSSNGIRVSTSSSSYSMKMIQIDAAINPGNSGGALSNMYGQVVGVTSSKIVSEGYDMVSYAIPSVTVKSVADSLINNGYVANRGKLGITYTEINSLTSEMTGMPKGLSVYTISEDSNLYNKGIEKEDVITHINDTEITNSSIALDIIESTQPGKDLTFTVYSKKNKQTFTVYASLIDDRGSSSYSDSLVINGNGSTVDPNIIFGNDSSDSSNSVKDFE